MRLYNFGILFGYCIGMFVRSNLVSRYPLSSSLCLALSCRIRAWQSLASANITVSVDPADSNAAWETENITAFSNLSWCKFSSRSAVRMALLSPSQAVQCCPSGIYVAREEFTLSDMYLSVILFRILCFPGPCLFSLLQKSTCGVWPIILRFYYFCTGMKCGFLL